MRLGHLYVALGLILIVGVVAALLSGTSFTGPGLVISLMMAIFLRVILVRGD